MKIEKVKITDLVSPVWNPRKISKKELDRLKQSLTEFGYVDPLIVNDVNMHIVGGNQRCLALKELGYTEIDVIFIHEPNLEKEKALNIALNKIDGDWDTGKLEDLLVDIELSDVSLDLTGFDDLDFREFDFNIRLPKKEGAGNPIIDEVIFDDDGEVSVGSVPLDDETSNVTETVADTTIKEDNNTDDILTVEEIKERNKKNLFDSIEYEDDTVTILGEETTNTPTIDDSVNIQEGVSSSNTKEPLTEEFTIPVLDDAETSNEIYDLLVRFEDYETREKLYTDLMNKGFNCMRK